MRIKLLTNGRLQVREQAGVLREVGPESPDYARLRKQYDLTARPNPVRARLIGVLLIVVGIAAWWYNWHQLRTEGVISVKLTILGPAGLLGGILMIWKPEWTGPIGPNSTKAHKTALVVLIVLMAALSGIDYYFLLHYRP